MTIQAWLRGPVPDVTPALQPVAHALIQAREDLERIVPQIAPEALWTSPGGAASPGFHLRHLAASTDRLLTYARGEPLSVAQRRVLATEKEAHPDETTEMLLDEIRRVISRALAQLRETEDADLETPRSVGGGELPSNVRGLLYHMGEHVTRHVGQLITTLNVSRAAPVGRAPSPGADGVTSTPGHTPPRARPSDD